MFHLQNALRNSELQLVKELKEIYVTQIFVFILLFSRLVAPEVINKKGFYHNYSFSFPRDKNIFLPSGHNCEVDVWSLGCILYTLLLGKPPFETSSLKETYSKIRKNDYCIPENRISRESASLIQRCLSHEPSSRPTMSQIYLDPFFAGFIPSTLPTSVCTVAPRYSMANAANQASHVPPILPSSNRAQTAVHAGSSNQQRRPFTEQQQNDQALINGRHGQIPTQTVHNERQQETHGVKSRALSAAPTTNADHALSTQLNRQLTGLNVQNVLLPPENVNEDLQLALDLQKQLDHLIQLKPHEKLDRYEDEAEDPASAPMLWISKWVDYSDKYGLGYQLCDDSVGVLFNDLTRLIMTAGGAENLQYIDRDGYEHLCTMKDYSEHLKKKVTLLKVSARFKSINGIICCLV